MANVTQCGDFERPGDDRRGFATVQLPKEKVEAIRTSRMDLRHAASRQAARPQIAEAHADPEPGAEPLVISYAYLFHREHQAGRG